MQAWLPAHHRLLRRVAGTARDDPNVGPGNQKRAQRSRADSWEREAHDVWPRSGRCEQTPDRLDPTFPHACSTPREGRRAVVTNSCALHPCTQCRGCRAIHSFFTRHDGLLRGTCHRARIRAARRLAMAMAEKLPRRRSSLIFSIHPSPGSVEQRTAALALLNANGEFRYVSSLPGGPAKRESPRRCSDHANPACLGGESTRHDRSFECRRPRHHPWHARRRLGRHHLRASPGSSCGYQSNRHPYLAQASASSG
jgi:hypothetical protein